MHIGRGFHEVDTRTVHEVCPCTHLGKCGDLMVSTLVSGWSGPDLSPGEGHCVVF